MLCFLEAWESIDSNKTIGLLTANDSEGVEISTFINHFASAKGYTIVDPGNYQIGMDSYSEFVETFARADCDIIVGVMNPEDFSVFWRECTASGYRPKMCTVAKACLFSSDVENLGEIAHGLITEVWWTEAFPYVSSITGWSCPQLAEDYRANYDSNVSVVPPTVGYKHANVEILYDILQRAGSLKLDAINKAAVETNLDTIVGYVAFNSDHVSIMPCVTGQWIMNPDGSFRQEIVGNYLIPEVEDTADIILLPEA
jgi:branched-chain amino acid transport system substrate-binding protein